MAQTDTVTKVCKADRHRSRQTKTVVDEGTDAGKGAGASGGTGTWSLTAEVWPGSLPAEPHRVVEADLVIDMQGSRSPIRGWSLSPTADVGLNTRDAMRCVLSVAPYSGRSLWERPPLRRRPLTLPRGRRGQQPVGAPSQQGRDGARVSAPTRRASPAADPTHPPAGQPGGEKEAASEIIFDDQGQVADRTRPLPLHPPGVSQKINIGNDDEDANEDGAEDDDGSCDILDGEVAGEGMASPSAQVAATSAVASRAVGRWRARRVVAQ